MSQFTRKTVQKEWPEAWSAWVKKSGDPGDDVFWFSDGRLRVKSNDLQESYSWSDTKKRWQRGNNASENFDKFMDDILIKENARQFIDEREETPQRIRARSRREKTTNLIKFNVTRSQQ